MPLSPIASRSAGRVRLRDFSTWPIAWRVIAVSAVLSALAVLIVGTFLSTSISNALFEQRKDRSLENTQVLRQNLQSEISLVAPKSATEQQEVMVSFIDRAGQTDPSAIRGVAVAPVNGAQGLTPVSSNGALNSWANPEFTQNLAANGLQNISFQSVEYLNKGVSEPAILAGTRVRVPGTGDFDLVVLYSVKQEQLTLRNLNTILAASGILMIVLFLGVGFVIERIVTAPLKRAARAAERISRGDRDYRVRIQGGDHLARVGTSFNNMAATLQRQIVALEDMTESQRRFVSDVSHELRTPLTTIKLASTVIHGAREELPQTVDRAASLLHEQVVRFDLLLADLLEISRHDADGAELDGEEEALSECVDRVVSLLDPLAKERGSELRVSHKSEDTLAVFERSRIERIVRNLITNALEHGQGKPIIVETASTKSAVCVVVQDFGIGLDENEAKHVFDRFWRADKSRKRTLGGSGLGLAISQEDAELHGGTLEVWGRKGYGAVFRLTLPRAGGLILGVPPLPLEREGGPEPRGRRRAT